VGCAAKRGGGWEFRGLRGGGWREGGVRRPGGGGGLGKMLNLLTVKTYHVTKHTSSKHLTWTDNLVRNKKRNRDMRFSTWNVRSLYRAGSLTAAARELLRYKLDLVGVQELRWD